jgi:hypothetical protein
MAKIMNKILAILVLSGFVAAQNPISIRVCTWIAMVRDTLLYIGPALVVIMFTYGGLKYVFSADDPGGRKAGKMTCIHAIIGGIIITLVTVVSTIIFGGWTSC